MRANITINEHGAIRASNGGAPLDGGLQATRINQKFTITLGKAPTVNALLTLIQTLRAIDSSMTIAVPKNMVWPDPPPITTQPIGNCLEYPMN